VLLKGLKVSDSSDFAEQSEPHGAASWAAAAFHPLHFYGPAGAERRTFPADEGDIADAIKFLAVGKQQAGGLLHRPQ
jgi:hypothetical protein